MLEDHLIDEILLILLSNGPVDVPLAPSEETKTRQSGSLAIDQQSIYLKENSGFKGLKTC